MNSPDRLFGPAAAARKVEALYRTPDIVAQRAAILDRVAPVPGERVLDVGCGPGLLAAEIAARVGPGGAVRGIDRSDSMVDIARDNAAGLAHAGFEQGSATDLPVPDAAFDVVTCTQVLEYVDDVPAALAEFRRVLRPGGRVAIVDTDWESCVWASGDDARMRRVIEAWNLHCPHPHLPRSLASWLIDAGFEAPTVEVLPLVAVGRAAGTYGAGMIDVIARYVTSTGTLDAQTVDTWRDDLAQREADGRSFFAVSRFLFVAARP